MKIILISLVVICVLILGYIIRSVQKDNEKQIKITEKLKPTQYCDALIGGKIVNVLIMYNDVYNHTVIVQYENKNINIKYSQIINKPL